MPDRPRDWTRSCGRPKEPWGGWDLRQWRAEEQGAGEVVTGHPPRRVLLEKTVRLHLDHLPPARKPRPRVDPDRVEDDD